MLLVFLAQKFAVEYRLPVILWPMQRGFCAIAQLLVKIISITHSKHKTLTGETKAKKK